MKRVLLVLMVALGAAMVLAHATTTDVWAACGGKGEDPCPPPSNDKEKKQHQPAPIPPTATFTSTPAPTATATSMPAATYRPVPMATQAPAAIAAATPTEVARPQPRCWAWLGLLVAGAAYLLIATLSRTAQVKEVAVRGYDTNRRREITGRRASSAIQSMSFAGRAALYASALLALAGAAGLILALPCASSLPAAAGAGALGLGLAVMGRLPIVPRRWLGGSTASGDAAGGQSESGKVDLAGMSIEDAVMYLFELVSGDARRDQREQLEEMDAERRRRAALRGLGGIRPPEDIGPDVGSGLSPDPAEPDVRYTLFLPDGTPARGTAHVAMKNSGKTASKKSATDSSSDKDSDGDGR